MQFRMGVSLARRGRNITKRSLMLLLASLSMYHLAIAQEGSTANSGPWSGVIINTGCTVDEAFAEAAKCTDNVPGAKLVLYDDTIRKIYELDPQTQAASHLGDSVTVEGALDNNTIHTTSIKLHTAIGLPVGQKGHRTHRHKS